MKTPTTTTTTSSSGTCGSKGRRLLATGACCSLMLSLGAGAAAAADASETPVGGGGGGGGSSLLRGRRLSQYLTPKVHGYPIDYCLHYELAHYGPDNALVSRRGDGCGKAAADKFCQLEGYPESEFNTAIYYSHNATWVLGDDTLNPRDENMGKGEHTWFDRISCKHPQVGPATLPVENQNTTTANATAAAAVAAAAGGAGAAAGGGQNATSLPVPPPPQQQQQGQQQQEGQQQQAQARPRQGNRR